MEFGGTYRFSAPRETVWAALNSTEVLGAAIPGCRRIEWTSGTTLECEIQVNFGVISPVFLGDLTLSNVIAAERYTLSGRGRGGMLGKAEAAADISLLDDGPATVLSFRAQGGADGGIMKLGKALLAGSAQKVIDGFFLRIGRAMAVDVMPLPANDTAS